MECRGSPRKYHQAFLGEVQGLPFSLHGVAQILVQLDQAEVGDRPLLDSVIQLRGQHGGAPMRAIADCQTVPL